MTFDRTALFFGEGCVIGDNLKVFHPKIKHIKALGEDCGGKYSSLFMPLATTSFEKKLALFSLGYDYEKMDDFTGFCMLFANYNLLFEKGEIESNVFADSLKYFCGDENSDFVLIQKNKTQDLILIDRNFPQRCIFKEDFSIIRDFLREIHFLPEPDRSIAADEETKKEIIEAEIEKLEENAKTKDDFLETILTSVSFGDYYIPESDLLNMPIYRLYAGYRRLDKTLAYKILQPAFYAGTIKLTGTQKENILWSGSIH